MNQFCNSGMPPSVGCSDSVSILDFALFLGLLSALITLTAMARLFFSIEMSVPVRSHPELTFFCGQQYPNILSLHEDIFIPELPSAFEFDVSSQSMTIFSAQEVAGRTSVIPACG